MASIDISVMSSEGKERSLAAKFSRTLRTTLSRPGQECDDGNGQKTGDCVMEYEEREKV